MRLERARFVKKLVHPAKMSALKRRMAYSVGISLKAPGDYRVSVRVKDDDARQWFLDRYRLLVKKYNDEIEVKTAGELTPRLRESDVLVEAMALPAPGTPQPLSIGGRIRHIQGHFGTIGFFARHNGNRGFVSCNHVIARKNQSEPDAQILDGLSRPVGTLGFFHELRKFHTKADCAYAVVDNDQFWPENPGSLGDDGDLDPLDADLTNIVAVRKVGAQSGRTEGHVTRFEVDGFDVDYGGDTEIFNVRFNDVVEIEGNGNSFSDPGDSGALVYSAGDNRPVGLVFREEPGKSPGSRFRSYVNPINLVRKALDVKIVVKND